MSAHIRDILFDYMDKSDIGVMKSLVFASFNTGRLVRVVPQIF